MANYDVFMANYDVFMANYDYFEICHNKAIEQVWHDVPNGTRFRHKTDSSEWVKDFDCLRNSDNRTVPEGQIINIFQYLEEISE